MTTIFTEPSISGYNPNPPDDDGTNSEANRLKWATHVTKLAGPVKTLAEAIASNLTTAFARTIGGAGILEKSTSYEVTSADQGKTIVMTTAGTTLTTPAASSVESPFAFHFVNVSAGNVTIDGNGAETVDNVGSHIIPPGQGGYIETDGDEWFTSGRPWDAPLPKGYMTPGGLTLLIDTDTDHDINVAVGVARSQGDDFNFNVSSALTKKIDANWVAGDEFGGFPSGLTLAADTIYHVFLVDDGAGNTDAGFDTSPSAANLLIDTTGSFYKRVGSISTDASANIVPFLQVDRWFLPKDPPRIFNTAMTLVGGPYTISLNTTDRFKVPSIAANRVHCRFNMDGSPAVTRSDVYLWTPGQNSEVGVFGGEPTPQLIVGTNGEATEVHAWSGGVNANQVLADVGNEDMLNFSLTFMGYYDPLTG
jgi:hypothetical protein